MSSEADTADVQGMGLGKKIAFSALFTVLGVCGAVGGMYLTPGGKAGLYELAGLDPDATVDPEEEIQGMTVGHGAEAEQHAADEGGHGAAAGGHGAPAPGPAEFAVSPFKEIIVNINATTATGRVTSRFMKLNVALVYDATVEGAERVEERRLFLRDSFQDYLRQLEERDLRGSIGLATVKQELLHRARVITESESPQEMLVSDLIVQ
jgi:flagellar FliL protein